MRPPGETKLHLFDARAEVPQRAHKRMKGRADVRDAEATTEDIAGFGATRERAHQRFNDLEKKNMTDQGAREAETSAKLRIGAQGSAS